MHTARVWVCLTHYMAGQFIANVSIACVTSHAEGLQIATVFNENMGIHYADEHKYK